MTKALAVLHRLSEIRSNKGGREGGREGEREGGREGGREGRAHLPRRVSVHDEAHDGLEVVAVEGHLRLLRHVYPASVPRALAVPDPLHTLPAVGGLEELRPTGKARMRVCVCACVCVCVCVMQPYGNMKWNAKMSQITRQ